MGTFLLGQFKDIIIGVVAKALLGVFKTVTRDRTNRLVGALDVQVVEAAERRKIRRAAREIRSRPVPDDAHDVIDRLRPPGPRDL